MSKLYLEIFDPDRKKIFKKLSFFKKYGILAGGTALSLQIKHRKSFDFDIFLSRPIRRQFFKKVIQVFGDNIITRLSTGDILMIETEEKVAVHFVYVWYKRLYEPVQTDSIDIAAISDIAADKAHIIGRRGEWRDYVDVFFLLKSKILTLDGIIENAQKKYRPEFNPRLFLEQLTYFEDIKDFTVSFLEQSYTTEEIKEFLIENVKKFKF